MKLRKETSINDAFTVDSIITVYYLEWEKAMQKSQNGHDVSYNFWQLLYIDCGEYTCKIEENTYTLSSGQLILAEPNKVRTSISCKNAMIAIISFRCASDGMNNIKNRIITLSDDDRKLLSRVLTAGTDIFKAVTDDPQYDGQAPKDGTSDYELQMIKNSLELLFISLYEPYRQEIKARPTAQNHINYYENKFRLIESYLSENLSGNITLNEISIATGFSLSTIKRIFQSQAGCGALHYFIKLKIKEAKRLIKETDMSITEISEKLGFNSIHYFSRAFTQKYNIKILPAFHQVNMQNQLLKIKGCKHNCVCILSACR